MTTDPITLRDIEGAARLAGVGLTAAEAALMLDNLDGQIALARARRAHPLGNAAPMASRFDPRPPGFVMPAGPGRLDLPSGPVPALPDTAADIAFAPLAHLSHWVHHGQISARGLTEIYLDRIARHGAGLACFAKVTADLALAQADAADAALAAGRWLGPLHGMPYGLKDLFDTAGIETAWGAEPFVGRVPETDATIVARLRDAGAILLGKTSLGALAYNDIWYGGRTRNPWNREEGSSGSSAGSASATAAGLCAFAIGTETLGSITSPCQRCGTTGLRPTFGRVPRGGAMALCWSMDKVGPICRSVTDTAMVLAALNGADPGDRDSIEAPFSCDLRAGIDGLRVGYLPAAFADPATTATDHATLDAVRALGLVPIPLELPDLPYGSLMSILYAEAAAAFEELTLDGRDDTLTWQGADAWPNLFRKARFISAVDHVQADRLRWQVMLALDRLFQTVDVLVGPFNAGPMLVASNFTGHPCLHMRTGFADLPTRAPGSLGAGKVRMPDAVAGGALHRVPQGISIWSGLFNEGAALRLGLALERQLGVVDLRPDGLDAR